MTKPANKKMHIGIVGRAASGKDSVANAFEAFGYEHVSSSDCVREEIVKRGEAISRNTQTEVANHMRRIYGDGYWVERAINEATKGTGRIAISGLYSAGEGSYLVNSLGGCLVGVVASPVPEDDKLVRFNRLQQRADGQRDRLNFEEFEAAELRENSGTQTSQANIQALLEMASFTINNSGDLDYLEAQVQAVAQQLEVQI